MRSKPFPVERHRAGKWTRDFEDYLDIPSIMIKRAAALFGNGVTMRIAHGTMRMGKTICLWGLIMHVRNSDGNLLWMD